MPGRRQSRRRVLLGLIVAFAAVPRLAASAGQSPYGMERPFHVRTNGFTFGQAPDFSPTGEEVLFNQDYGGGEQIYLARPDGSGRRCVTCSQAGPNMVPHFRPQGDRVLYHSWQGHHLTLGAPGFGGLGADLWVVNPDGTDPVNLTTSPEGEDNYHAYWSPDGKQLAWAHLNWNFVTDGGQGKWDIRVADYVPSPRPHLANVRIVRPANGHYYETQWWAPDGSGFLYTESVGNAMNLELFSCRLVRAGCEVHRLTRDPSWDEEAIFTPDGRSVVFMSARGQPSLWNSWAGMSWSTGLPATYDYLLTLPLFEAGFLQPVAAAATDLYQVDPATLAVRRLTTDGDKGWIIPEVAWDPAGRSLFWTEQKYPDGVRVSEPVDPVLQAQQLAAFLRHPPIPDAHAFDSGRPGFLLQARTRVGTFG
jgi:Tol biopolymer transport system component